MGMGKSAFEYLDFVAIGIGDEGHFEAAGGEFFAPAGGPNFDASFLDGVAISDDVVHAERGVHQVFWAGGGVFWRVAELEEDVISGEFEKGEAVALGGVFGLGEGVAESLVEGDGGIQMTNADAGVEETDHGERRVDWIGGFAKSGLWGDTFLADEIGKGNRFSRKEA
jgi:hypothetical protein